MSLVLSVEQPLKHMMTYSLIASISDSLWIYARNGWLCLRSLFACNNGATGWRMLRAGCWGNMVLGVPCLVPWSIISGKSGMAESMKLGNLQWSRDSAASKKKSWCGFMQHLEAFLQTGIELFFSLLCRCALLGLSSVLGSCVISFKYGAIM